MQIDFSKTFYWIFSCNRKVSSESPLPNDPTLGVAMGGSLWLRILLPRIRRFSFSRSGVQTGNQLHTSEKLIQYFHVILLFTTFFPNKFEKNYQGSNIKCINIKI